MSENIEIPGMIEDSEIGSITFANEVVATIASLAASEINGVANMSGSVADEFVEFLGRKSNTKGIRVEVGAKEASVECYIVVKYGFKLQQVALDVQSNIKSAIETMLGLSVPQVNVSVVGIEYKEAAK